MVNLIQRSERDKPDPENIGSGACQLLQYRDSNPCLKLLPSAIVPLPASRRRDIALPTLSLSSEKPVEPDDVERVIRAAMFLEFSIYSALSSGSRDRLSQVLPYVARNQNAINRLMEAIEDTQGAVDANVTVFSEDSSQFFKHSK